MLRGPRVSSSSLSRSVVAPKAVEEDFDDEDDITSDIFDESLRYSNVDRPKLEISHSSPQREQQIRGEFVTEEERIANLFATKKTAKA